MEYEIEVLETIIYKTESLKDILDKFYSDCSGHLSVGIKDKNGKEIILGLESNDIENNIMMSEDSIETEWYIYPGYEDLLDDLKVNEFDINSLTLIKI